MEGQRAPGDMGLFGDIGGKKDKPPTARSGSTPGAKEPPCACGVCNAKDEGSRSGAKPPPARKGTLLPRLIAAAAVLTFGWFATMMGYYTVKNPDPLSIQGADGPNLKILARDGSLLAEHGKSHPYIPIDLLPPHVVQAVIAIEDRRFYEHSGIDFMGMARAAFANLRAGRYVQGGSTITQQLAKNLYLSPQRTLMRKVDELLLAVWLELRLEKRDILELYLNHAYFGGGAFGIETAAQRHFGKSARALSVVEGAIIAGLLKAPSRYSPSTDPAAARTRGRVVLQAMHEAGFLSEAELAKALTQPVRFESPTISGAIDGTEYATEFILERMPLLLSGHSGTLVVETSLDKDLQKLAQRRLSHMLARDGKKLNASQGAVVVLDVGGGIRALVGGVNYSDSQYNRATRALRQPGSTFKPFVYLAALEKGMRPESIVQDLPLSIGGWTPRNVNGQYRGEVTLREALAKSINTVAVRLAIDLTPSVVAATARRSGIVSKLREDASLALGTSEVSLLELTAAYALFANGGRRIEPHVIRRIRTASGRVLYAHAENDREVVTSLRHVGAMNDMLNAALVEGTGRKAAIAVHPAAGKTGTSQDFRDAWFVGYTAHLVTGVWLGNDDGKPMDHVVGGSLPARIWQTVMNSAHEQLPPLPLPGTYRPGTRIGPAGSPYAERQPEPAQNKISRERHRQAQVQAAHADTPSGSGHASIAPPPLPGRQQKSGMHPEERISADFIARAVDAVPTQSAGTRKTVRAGPSGFDVDAIRERLEGATQPNGAPTPFMALGAAGRDQ
jgi:penicillin-binding protein 1A